jgi:hypothetical protein
MLFLFEAPYSAAEKEERKTDRVYQRPQATVLTTIMSSPHAGRNNVPLFQVSLSNEVKPIRTHGCYTAKDCCSARSTDRDVSLVPYVFEPSDRGHVPIRRARRDDLVFERVGSGREKREGRGGGKSSVLFR